MSRTRDLAIILGKTEATNTTNVALGTGSGVGAAVGFCSFNLADPTNTVGDTLNHSGITDAGSGLATLSFTTSFAAVDYTACSSNPFVASSASRNFSTGPYNFATGSIGIAREDANGSANEPNAHGPGLAFFGTLA
tara:strand:- start:1863 stop:2270 length:408 start_codon:yes stop_codon:yes gene_type:complete